MKTGDANEVYSIVRLLKKNILNLDILRWDSRRHVGRECEKIFDTIIIGPGENNFKLALKSNLNKLEDKYTNVRFQTHLIERNLLPVRSVIMKMFKQYGDYNATMVYFSKLFL